MAPTTYGSGGVCVFDLDGTVIGVDASLSRGAIEVCKQEGFALAVNTAESYSGCSYNRARVESLGLQVPDDVYLCYEEDAGGVVESKLENMYTIARYYGSSKSCTLLFDDTGANIKYVSENGFAAQQVDTEDDGISKGELQSGLAQLQGCNSFELNETTASK